MKDPSYTYEITEDEFLVVSKRLHDFFTPTNASDVSIVSDQLTLALI